MAVSVKKFNELRSALDLIESALYGCEAIDWEELPELFKDASKDVVIRLPVKIDEFRRLKLTLDMVNRIVNDPEYNPIK